MEQSKQKKISTIGFFKYFKGIIGYRVYLYILLSIVVALFDGLGLAMFIPLLSIATGGGSGVESLGNLAFVVEAVEKMGFSLNLLTALCLMIGLFVVKSVFYYIRTIYFVKIRLLAVGAIRLNLVEGLRGLSYSGFTKLDAGKIQNNMVGETSRLINSMTYYFNAILHVVMMTTYVVLAFSSNWKFAIMVGIGGAITNALYKYVNEITKKYSRKQTLLGNDFNGNLIQSINHFKYLKATNYFQRYATKLAQNIKDNEVYTYKMGKVGSIAESLREPIIIIVIAAVIFIQVQLVGESFGGILTSLLLFYRALAHLVSMQGSWNTFVANSAGLESIEMLLEDFKNHKEYEGTAKIESIGNIELKNIEIVFSSSVGKVLDDIHLSIQKNTSIALVGESGAGKTTLANIISGLLPPTAGKVMVSGCDLYGSELSSFRQKVGYITQEPVIFDDTLFNNVTFWAEKNEGSLRKFKEVMEMVSMSAFLEQHDEDVLLGNNGVLISGGQKQRISIARELYKDVELLVMDEATSALDSETENHIKNSIDLLKGKFTIVIIAHRLSTIKDVDNIFLLDRGKIISQGKFDELYEASERFRSMAQYQKI